MKKTVAILLSVLMLVSFCLPAGALQLETVETTEETSTVTPETSAEEASEVTLSQAGWFAPGLNAANGTDAVETFTSWTGDNANYVSSTNFNTRVLGTAPTTISEAGNNCIVFTRNASTSSESYPQIVLMCRMEKGRTYSLAYKMYYDGIAQGKTNDICLWTMTESGAVVESLGESLAAASKANEWYSYSNTAFTWTAPTTAILRLQVKQSKVTADSGITAFNWYLDDVMLMPYYKITYVNDDGTVLASEQVLYDGEGKILTSYTPKADNYPTWDGTKDGSAKTCIGWSTQQNADAPMNTVALSHADVLLYPVWQTEEAGFFTADTDVMSALTGKTLEITAKTAVDSWLIDKGNTDAEIVTTDNSVTVTATGYAGEILITAVVGEETYTMTVRLFSGEKWKPGLNTVTGTEEPFDFELNDGTIFSTAFSGVDGTTRYWFAGANPSVSGINTSAQAVYVTRQFAYLHPLQSYATPIEKERPLNYAFDVMSSNSLYAMINGVAGGASGNIYSSNRGASTVWKRESITVNLSKDTCESSGLPTGAAADGIKWMGVGPKSGTYTANLSSGYVWLDNVSYVPYYKITYIGLDGETVAAVDYALYDESGNFLHEYTPNNSLVEGATGFALTPGGACKASIPLNHEDIVLYATDRQEIRFAEVAVPVDTTKPFTLPDPEEIGLDVDNFRVWLDADGNKYYAGTVYEGTALEDLIGMNLTPYSQDASMSAMGMAFEAGASAKNVNIASVGDAKANYVEYMQDDGRDILHVHTYKNTNSGTDTRISLNGTASMDANEYNIIQYSYKVNALANTDLTPVSSVEFKIFFNNTLGNGFWCSDKSTGCSGEHIPNGKYTAYVSDDYALTEIDMGLAENNYAVHGWADSGKITALYVDPAKVNVKGLLDVYIDYLRVYRDGIFTVTYDTNAPEFYEDAVLSEVAPDTGRGAGTGYLLKGERPAIDGQIFRGWALTPDATPEEVVDSVDLVGDLTVYAVWTEDTIACPNAENTASIRSGADGVNGIRFRSSVKADTKAFLDEYGFLVARKDILGDSELTFAFKDMSANKPLYVSGVSYSKKDNVDLQYEVQPNGTTVFTAVCVNIPQAHYSTELVARPYAKYSNSNGLSFTLYGTSVTRSIAQVAQSIKDAGGEDYTNNQEYIDSILGA